MQNATKDEDFNPFVDFPTRPIKDKMWIKLNHTISRKMLHSHDHRPPVSEVDWQNEVSGYGFDGFAGDANDQWMVEILPDYSTGWRAKRQLQAINTKFRLKHVLSGCYLFSHKVKLPEFGFGQQEVTCNRVSSIRAVDLRYANNSGHRILACPTPFGLSRPTRIPFVSTLFNTFECKCSFPEYSRNK